MLWFPEDQPHLRALVTRYTIAYNCCLCNLLHGQHGHNDDLRSTLVDVLKPGEVDQLMQCSSRVNFSLQVMCFSVVVFLGLLCVFVSVLWCSLKRVYMGNLTTHITLYQHHTHTHTHTRLSQVMSEAVRAARMSDICMHRMDDNLSYFQDVVGACIRILQTPIPLSYTRHTRWV